MSDDVVVVPYRAELAPAFEALNREWIERFFEVEAADEAVFADPEGTVIAGGGQIFFALLGGEPVGTVAVFPHRGEYELAKMAVTPRAQGRGIGDRLLEAAVRFARDAGVDELVLVTNSSLAPAIRLYEKHGFRHVPVDPATSEYARADVRMTLRLRP
jgi:ribosomal protein S18 acetylase RimI-like enzyme